MNREFAVAIVGMAGRFPGARNLEQFWENLHRGRESVTFFTEAELVAAGIGRSACRQPNYVNARAILDDIESFDAEFFGFSAREAEITDPQHRLFLECAWEAVENSGYDVDRLHVPVAVFAGASLSTYLFRLQATPQAIDAVGSLRVLLGNDKDHLPTWVSYKLNLTGISVNVQTACSTSLTAVHLARQALLDHECDMALAGGVTVTVPQRAGYLYQEAGILARDGHCRAFDANATGTVPGEGVGVVALKRLEDALRDGDCIRAVILGSAANNDGMARVSFSAPGVNGQTEVIANALAVAGIKPGQISLVEAHGSGTSLGDSIEIAALRGAFADTPTASVALGSVKTNIGHASAAAGIAGLIKTVLALEQGVIPPSLGFDSANPRTGLHDSPFFINTQARLWPCGPEPRRAGVSSFGVGGTNVHVVLEEAEAPHGSNAGRPVLLGIWSARTAAALEQMTDRLAEHLREHSELSPPDVAYTLQVGRKAFSHRRAVVVENVNDFARTIATRDQSRMLTHACCRTLGSVVFMFPGTGDQYIGMSRGLYQSEPVFREHFDRCADLLRTQLSADLRSVLYGDTDAPWVEDARLSHPALFSVQYSLAQLWMSWGVRPSALMGYSLGETVASCLAGVMSLEDALRLVVARAKLMHSIAPGAMLAVLLGVAKLEPLLRDGVCLAAVNGPMFSVVSGPLERIETVRQSLTARGVFCRRIGAERAFHSSMMDRIAPELVHVAESISLRPPQIPYISNLTGTWVTNAQATDPEYWGRHLRGSIHFWAGLETVCIGKPAPVLLEIGPGQMLSSLVAQLPADEEGVPPLAVPSMPSSQDQRSDLVVLIEAAARLWITGVEIDWRQFSIDEQRRRVALPTYPFQRERYWVDAPAPSESEDGSSLAAAPRMFGRPPELIPSVSASVRSKPATRGRSHLMRPYAPPKSPTEKIVAECWQELFGISPIGIHDRFIELGGNSLIAGQLALGMQNAFQISFPLHAVLKHATVAEMAVHVQSLLIEEIEHAAMDDGAASVQR